MPNLLSFVAFIDVLGFAHMVESDFNSSEPATKYYPKLKNAINAVQASSKLEDIDILQFSDSIVLSKKFSRDQQDFVKFLEACADLQIRLFFDDILTRGGISHGEHIKEDILFSRALIDAYRIESNISSYPRIVISNETLELLYPSNNIPKIALRDVDGFHFIDYLFGSDINNIISILDRIRSDLRSEQQSIRSKIAWLFQYAHLSGTGVDLPEEITLKRYEG